MSATLYAIERVLPYIKGGNTGEVAEDLEKRYGLCERFFNFISQDLESKFMYFLERDLKLGIEKAFDNACFFSSEWLTNEWHLYIEQAKTGIITKASQGRDTPSFIDTGNYYANMRYEIRMSK